MKEKTNKKTSKTASNQEKLAFEDIDGNTFAKVVKRIGFHYSEFSRSIGYSGGYLYRMIRFKKQVPIKFIRELQLQVGYEDLLLAYNQVIEEIEKNNVRYED